MPRLDLDMFDDAPKVGDKVKVTGKVESIDEDTGEVEVSYDDVDIVGKEKKRKKRRSYDTNDEVVVEMETMPNTQTLDEALSQSFPNTQ